MRPSTFLAALFTSALAAPADHRLEDIQCRCLSFSTNAKPTLCTHMESHAFDYYTASSLASDYDLKIQFASETTITKVLSIHRPLPSSVLYHITEGEVMPIESNDLLQRENKIVCGFGDEVKHLGSYDRSMEPDCHFVGIVVAGFLALIAFYVACDYVWSRFFAQGTIKLDGDEKALMAEYNGQSTGIQVVDADDSV